VSRSRRLSAGRDSARERGRAWRRRPGAARWHAGGAPSRGPTRKIVRKLQLATNDAGFVTADLAFETFVNTGKYTVSLQVGGVAIGQYQFNVEELCRSG